MPFIVKIDNYEDYRNLYGHTEFSRIGFEMLVDHHEDIDVNLDEIGKLENYFSEYSSLLDAAEEYIDDQYIKDYNDPDSEHFEETEWLLKGFEERDMTVLYDHDSDVAIVDLR